MVWSHRVETTAAIWEVRAENFMQFLDISLSFWNAPSNRQEPLCQTIVLISPSYFQGFHQSSVMNIQLISGCKLPIKITTNNNIKHQNEFSLLGSLVLKHWYINIMSADTEISHTYISFKRDNKHLRRKQKHILFSSQHTEKQGLTPGEQPSRK